MNIDFAKIPTYCLPGFNFESPRDISEFFQRKGIKYYCYSIDVMDPKTMQINCAKKGMSADIKSDYGERLYRQIAHLRSWGSLRILGSSGADFINVEELFLGRYGYKIHHRCCIITIYDMTNYPFVGFDPRVEILAAEELLIMEHEKKFKERPPGNLIESYSNVDRAIVSKLHFEGLFFSQSN